MAEAIQKSLHVNQKGGVQDYYRRYEHSRQDSESRQIISQKRNGRGALEASTETIGILMPDTRNDRFQKPGKQQLLSLDHKVKEFSPQPTRPEQMMVSLQNSTQKDFVVSNKKKLKLKPIMKSKKKVPTTIQAKIEKPKEKPKEKPGSPQHEETKGRIMPSET